MSALRVLIDSYTDGGNQRYSLAIFHICFLPSMDVFNFFHQIPSCSLLFLPFTPLFFTLDILQPIVFFLIFCILAFFNLYCFILSFLSVIVGAQTSCCSFSKFASQFPPYFKFKVCVAALGINEQRRVQRVQKCIPKSTVKLKTYSKILAFSHTSIFSD